MHFNVSEVKTNVWKMCAKYFGRLQYPCNLKCQCYDHNINCSKDEMLFGLEHFCKMWSYLLQSNQNRNLHLKRLTKQKSLLLKDKASCKSPRHFYNPWQFDRVQFEKCLCLVDNVKDSPVITIEKKYNLQISRMIGYILILVDI